jgi:hypothetical protein
MYGGDFLKALSLARLAAIGRFKKLLIKYTQILKLCMEIFRYYGKFVKDFDFVSIKKKENGCM